jgi:toxin FitB
MTYLLDTNLVSELRLRHPNAHVVSWAKRHGIETQYISVITLMEIEVGICRVERKDKVQAERLRVWFRGLQRLFSTRTLVVDAAIALQCGTLHSPDPRPERDSFLAATAHVHNLIVATRNTRDFVSLGVSVVDPWLAQNT